jgi:cystathionine gamma-synthase
MNAIETRCIHGSADFQFDDPAHGISFPIYQTASYGHTALGEHTGYDYTRETNPTRAKLESVVSALEGAADTMAFTSGMAAINCCLELFSPGDHIVCSEDLYGGTNRILKTVSQKNGMTVSFLDTADLSAVEQTITDHTRAIYLETPTNPMMMVTDIAATAELCRKHGIKLIVDNTFLSPYFQNPLELGADMVIHSGSKFLCGHNDTLSGFLCIKDPDLALTYREIYKTLGGGLSPFDSWLVLRGIKTLPMRMERQQANAMEVVQWLAQQPKIQKVYYVGRKEHPGYDINRKQARGFGSMISFCTDTKETAVQILENVKLVTFAESLGGVESLITYPREQTHPDLTEEERQHLGITDTLLRLSVGAEAPEDIIGDLKQALEG